MEGKKKKEKKKKRRVQSFHELRTIAITWRSNISATAYLFQITDIEEGRAALLKHTVNSLHTLFKG